MKHKFDYDYLIIGGGVAGESAAITAASLNLKVGIVDYHKWGENKSTNFPVALQSALNISNVYRQSLLASRFGLSSHSLRFNYPAILNSINLAGQREASNSKQKLLEYDIDCIEGFAHFISPYEISVGEKRLKAKNFLVSTGRELVQSGISGSENTPYLVPEQIFANTNNRLPQAVFVIGGGKTGCEVAQYFASLGTKVLIAELSSRLLPNEDEDTGRYLEDYFSEQLNITVLTHSRVVGIEKDTVGKRVIFLRGGEEKVVRVEEIILANGKNPAIDCGLDNAGVKYQKDGIIVDKFLRTSMKHIAAAGGASSNLDSFERAGYEGRIATINLFQKKKIPAEYNSFPRVINTFPKISVVGLTEDDCIKRDLKFNKHTVYANRVSAANISDFQDGFLKLIVSPRGQILGATAFCLSADEIIQELSFAINQNLNLKAIISTPHISSSWSELIRLAATEILS